MLMEIDHACCFSARDGEVEGISSKGFSATMMDALTFS